MIMVLYFALLSITKFRGDLIVLAKIINKKKNVQKTEI